MHHNVFTFCHVWEVKALWMSYLYSCNCSLISLRLFSSLCWAVCFSLSSSPSRAGRLLALTTPSLHRDTVCAQYCPSFRQARVQTCSFHLHNVFHSHLLENVQTHQKWHSVAPTYICITLWARLSYLAASMEIHYYLCYFFSIVVIDAQWAFCVFLAPPCVLSQ